MKGFCMEEEILKIYDNLYNVIGVASRSEVHARGLLHQVVHLWMMEEKEGEKWLYFRQRSKHRKDFPGLYDLISSGHIDPEETFEEAIIESTAEKLGITLSKEDLVHIGNIRQIVDKGDYHDNAFCQIYFCRVTDPVFHLHFVEDVVKMRYEDFRAWIIGTTDRAPLYGRDGKMLCSTSKKDWWLREKEFLAVVNPYIEAL